MKKCPRCGRILNDRARACTYCGSSIRYNPSRRVSATPPVTSYKRNTRRRSGNGTVLKFIASLIIAFLVYFGVSAIAKSASTRSVSPSTVDDNAEIRRTLQLDNDDRLIYTGLAASGNNSDVRAELEDALLNRESTVCIIGQELNLSLFSSDNYQNDPVGHHYGEIRLMPYSSFWLKDIDIYEGSLRKDMLSYPVCIFHFSYYDYSESDIQTMKEQIDAETESIIACIPEGADDWLKCKTVHDELIRRLEYKHSDHSNDLYGALVEHQAVCEGYSLAFRYILSKLDIECNVVCSNWKDETEEAHAWNVVNVDSDENFIDVTWDDIDQTDWQGTELISYNYFGLTYNEMSSIESHDTQGQSYLASGSDRPFNYYRHEGYLFSVFDAAQIGQALEQQYQDGQHLLTVRFDNDDSYLAALDFIAGAELYNYIPTICEDLNTDQLNIRYYNDDTLRTISLYKSNDWA